MKNKANIKTITVTKESLSSMWDRAAETTVYIDLMTGEISDEIGDSEIYAPIEHLDDGDEPGMVDVIWFEAEERLNGNEITVRCDMEPFRKEWNDYSDYEELEEKSSELHRVICSAYQTDNLVTGECLCRDGGGENFVISDWNKYWSEEAAT